jgi:hypothetical protein
MIVLHSSNLKWCDKLQVEGSLRLRHHWQKLLVVDWAWQAPLFSGLADTLATAFQVGRRLRLTGSLVVDSEPHVNIHLIQSRATEI